ncbi:DNA methyltransferase [Thioalkalivibrio sp. HK1]|uniref:DNA methyltransferase n=1 Tax=Thioalkalivibrio sp. HK1 TaxID=1469245 RepID=UPI00046F8DF0|nr:DNA methyltransferase [Thioalkalivibrio sp. HK1]
MARKAKKGKNTEIEALVHDRETKRHIPTAEMEGLVPNDEREPVQVDYPRKNNPDENPELYARNPDLDPQLVWKGKDEEDREPLRVDAVPIYVQEHIQPKVIVDDIKRMAAKNKRDRDEGTIDLFADWEDELDPEDRIEFYQHDRRWTNRMILGDSLLVMNSLAEKEGLRGQVQCIYFDPPYGINFGSNWQVSTKSRSVSDRDLSREPETIQAFRDAWDNNISSYLPYLRDRLTVCRELLAESGSLFLQISDKNCHLVRSLLDEVFGNRNFIRQIFFSKTGSLTSKFLGRTGDILIWYAKNIESCKFRPLFEEKTQDNFYKNLETSYGIYRQIK